MIPDHRNFQVRETARATSNIYYRVIADGVELRSLVCISTSERSRTLEYELIMWCKFNARRLINGRTVRPDLNSVRDSFPASGELLRTASILDSP